MRELSIMRPRGFRRQSEGVIIIIRFFFFYLPLSENLRWPSSNWLSIVDNKGGLLSFENLLDCRLFFEIVVAATLIPTNNP